MPMVPSAILPSKPVSTMKHFKSSSKIVFVGNIPYGLTEEQITEIFSATGLVATFRLVYDRETGRSKGYGFAEYYDEACAASAVRNLDGHELMGRKLKVDYSSQGVLGVGTKGDSVPKGSAAVTTAAEEVAASLAFDGGRVGTPEVGEVLRGSPGLKVGCDRVQATLPVLPTGIELPPGLTAIDTISSILAAIHPTQLLDFLTEMKDLVTRDPAKATELLGQAPQLAYAVFQALVLMNLIDGSVLCQILGGAIQPQQPTTPTLAAASPTLPPPTTTTTTVEQSVNHDQAALLERVLAMSPEELACLSVEQQMQILNLRQQVMNSRRL